MADTKIEWADRVWNPITGCTPISEGCQNCYARRMANRLQGRSGYPKDNPFQVVLHPDRLDDPLWNWKKPRRIFACSMGDLFHEDIPDTYLMAIFQTMLQANWHTYMILTKRPDRMMNHIYNCLALMGEDTLPNHIWLGVTAENQARFDERTKILRQIPAAVRFVSVEPMLGPVELGFVGGPGDPDWVICGGETGPGARPVHPDWVRSLRDQCQAAGTPFFFKSWGDWAPMGLLAAKGESIYLRNNGGVMTNNDYRAGKNPELNPLRMVRVGKKHSGRLLDGQEWNEYPGARA